MARSKHKLSIADLIDGTPGDDHLHGTDGNDQVHGGDGNDTLYASLGNDVAHGNAGNDELHGGEQADTLYGEAGMDMLDGGRNDDQLYGGGNVDTLLGGNGDDLLDGGGGGDSMDGGAGDDRFIVDSLNDIAIETGAGDRGGHDVVESSVSWTLDANFEDLFLTGTANLFGAGNDESNGIQGNDGDNLLQGMGGYDFIYGGLGNDTLDGGTDGNSLDGGAGSDLIYGGGGNDDIDVGYGVSTDRDTVYGGNGSDTISCYTNFAVIEGGDGNDEYNIGAATGAQLIETPDGGGLDRVYVSGGSWTLAENIEYMHMYTSGRTDLLLAAGNESNNRILVTSYGGPTGNAQIYGMGGDDSLSVSNVIAYMDGGDGNDRLSASGTGSDTLIGGAGADDLHTWGGADLLTGGDGYDEFYFARFSGGVATITDFHAKQDTLVLAPNALAGLNVQGALAASAFYAGTSATTAAQRLIYDEDAGALYYDPDGNGAAAQSLIVNINVTTGVFNHNDINIEYQS